MSFILDALKKSESDRQQKNSGDSIFVQSGPASAPSHRWYWIVGSLLLINVIVLVTLVWISQGEPASPDSGQAAEASTAEPVDVEPTFRDRVAQARIDTPAPEPASTAPQSDLPRQSSEPAVTVAQPVVEAVPPSTITTVYLTIDEARANGSVQIPDLHLDIHVYSDTPSERFVFVNMSKYEENSVLLEGPRVAEIVPEGVILDYSGTQFLLLRE
jgi:general secretion pathway protein B